MDLAREDRIIPVIPEPITQTNLGNGFALLDELNYGVAVIDIDSGKTLYSNAAYQSLTGYSQGELAQLPVWDLGETDQAGSIREEFRQLGSQTLQSGVFYKFGYLKSRKTGTNLNFQIKPLEMGGKLLMMAITNDENTIYQEVNSPLNKSWVYYHFFKEAHDGLVLVGYGDGILSGILDVNDILCEWLGYSRQELLSLKNEDLIAPAYMPYFQRERKRLNQKAAADVRIKFNMAFVAKDGHVVTFEVTAHNIKAYGLSFNIFRNITDRKNMERRLSERYKKEKRLTEQLQEQIDRRIDFNRYLVHELKTPLTPLLGASEMLIGKLPDINLKRLAENVYRGAKNLDARVDDLMCMVRGEMGLLRLKVSQVDIAELMQDTVLYLKPWAENKKHTLSLKITPDLPTIQGDESRLSQVMLNLIGNAIKFTSPGGVIDVNVAKYGERVKIAIKDNGKGISLENQQWIFEPYSQRKQLGEEMSGLGIGLPLSKMIIQLHGGDIRVRSKPGKGSVFTVVLPLVLPFGDSVRKEINL